MAVINNPFAQPRSTGTPGNQPGNTGVNRQEIPNSRQDNSGIQDLNNSDLDNTDPNKLDPNKSKEGDDPLLNFKGLWENEAEDPKNPKPAKPSIVPNIDPAKFADMVGKIDFTKSITPEQVAAIAGGGENSVAALREIVNSSVRQAFVTGFQTNKKMLEGAMDNAKTSFLDEVPSHVKNVMVENGLNSSNAIMKDPAYSPLVEAVRQRYQEKYPKATPGAIEGAVNKYFDDMHAKMTGAKTSKEQQIPDNRSKLAKGDAAADWDAWLDEEMQQTQNANSPTM